MEFKELREALAADASERVIWLASSTVASLLAALDTAEARAREAERERDRLRAEDEAARAQLVDMLERAEDGDMPAACAWCGTLTSNGLDEKRAHQRTCAASPIVRDRDAAQARVRRLEEAIRDFPAFVDGDGRAALVAAGHINPHGCIRDNIDRAKWELGWDSAIAALRAALADGADKHDACALVGFGCPKCDGADKEGIDAG